MRHVILGSDTPLGASILRVLVSLSGQEIVCCNPDGIIPTDVPTTNIITFNVDIRKKNMLDAVIKKDDIIYNAQLFDDEDLIGNNTIDLHVQGLINLLKTGNEKRVKKIITYVPQKISWDVPLNADETSILIPSTAYQKSLLETISVAEHYMKGENYDLLELENDLSTESSNEIGIEENNEPISDIDEDNPIEDEDKSIASISPPSLSSDEPIGITSPNLGPPALRSPVSVEVDGEEIAPEIVSPLEDKAISINNEETDFEIPNENETEEEIIVVDTSVPLVLARIARFYGPFDEGITKSYCEAIRLQRIKVIGKINKNISWINPLDAGRAMIIMADDKVKQDQFNIVGFNATVMELLDELGKVNYSKTKIRRKLYFTRKISLKVKSLIGKVGIIKSINYEEVHGRNKTQTYSDEKARNAWGWKPKYDLSTTSKDALNWFVNHIL